MVTFGEKENARGISASWSWARILLCDASRRALGDSLLFPIRRALVQRGADHMQCGGQWQNRTRREEKIVYI